MVVLLPVLAFGLRAYPKSRTRGYYGKERDRPSAFFPSPGVAALAAPRGETFRPPRMSFSRNAPTLETLDQPMDDSSPLPPSLPLPPLPSEGGAAVDPELVRLGAPPRRARTVALCLMALTGLVAVVLAAWLVSDVRYALRPSSPDDVGDLNVLTPLPTMKDTFVQGEAVLGSAGGLQYVRAFEEDSFRLAPLRDNPRIWVELRVPDGVAPSTATGTLAPTDGVRLIPPTSFVGRFVPLSDAGLRYRGLAASVRRATGVDLAADTWILVDGATPHGSTWALPLAALLCAFALWNLAYFLRIARRIAR